MPAEGEPLSAEQVAILKRWIDMGAGGPDEPLPPDPRDHWSFRSPERPAALAGTDATRHTNPIDVLLAARHNEHGLQPVAEAAKPILLRRVYLDLIGLPPTPAQLRDFLADGSPDAFERVVDQLLASPQYGERWGRHWMDVWRYSDWDGYAAEVRESQPNIWRWRDWIIESLNADKPYDQMIREMLAADEIAPEDTAALRATGFLVRNWYRFNRNVWLDATVEHTGKAFLGITLNCARCHDHKYDPISQAEYYQFRAFFEPHEIRTDRAELAGGVGELVRTFDADLGRPTYLFARQRGEARFRASPLAGGADRTGGRRTFDQCRAACPDGVLSRSAPVCPARSARACHDPLEQSRDRARRRVMPSWPRRVKTRGIAWECCGRRIAGCCSGQGRDQRGRRPGDDAERCDGCG